MASISRFGLFQIQNVSLSWNKIDELLESALGNPGICKRLLQELKKTHFSKPVTISSVFTWKKSVVVNPSAQRRSKGKRGGNVCNDIKLISIFKLLVLKI